MSTATLEYTLYFTFKIPKTIKTEEEKEELIEGFHKILENQFKNLSFLEEYDYTDYSED